jgi:hypothetical protein
VTRSFYSLCHALIVLLTKSSKTKAIVILLCYPRTGLVPSLFLISDCSVPSPTCVSRASCWEAVASLILRRLRLLLFYSVILALPQSLLCFLMLDYSVPSPTCVSRLLLGGCSITYFKMTFKRRTTIKTGWRE